MQKNDYIFGIRAVMEAIQAGKDIDKILIKKDIHGELIGGSPARTTRVWWPCSAP